MFDKNKKIINKVENVNQIDGLIKDVKVENKKIKKVKKNNKLPDEKIKKTNLKKSKKKIVRTLWVRRKKKSSLN